MTIKRKIIFTAGLFLVIISFTAALTDAAAEQVKIYSRLPCKELIFQPGQLPSSHAPTIVELPGGELFAVWYAPVPGTSNAVLWGARKPVVSGKWTAPSIINSAPGFSNKNPVLYLGRDNRLFLFWAEEKRWFKWPRDTLKMKVSKDFGYTWDKARNLGTPVGFLPRTNPINLSDGRILLPVYTDFTTSSAVVTSRDGGMTWSAPKYILFLFGIQPTIIQRSDLSLFALTRTGMWPRLSWQAVSCDLGRSWKGQRVSNIKNPGCSLEMIKLHSGNVVLVFNDSKTSREGISIALSHDEGRTWPHVRSIDLKPGSTSIYPSIIQDSSGLIHVVYSYDCRQSIAHFVTDEKWIEGGSG
ncbi:MAG: sialidase family protein [Candidatus Omnitrophica bacterium]|nr:sialidase family protein [Candidatus Omnitrophota bacterium]